MKTKLNLSYHDNFLKINLVSPRTKMRVLLPSDTSFLIDDNIFFKSNAFFVYEYEWNFDYRDGEIVTLLDITLSLKSYYVDDEEINFYVRGKTFNENFKINPKIDKIRKTIEI